MKIAIIGPSGLPIPPVKGGAIETLVDVILRENIKRNEVLIDMFTIYDEEAKIKAKEYKNINFYFLCKHKKIVRLKNKFITLFRRIFKREISYTYAQQVCKILKKNEYDKVIIEGDINLVKPISKFIDKDKIYLHIHHNALEKNKDRYNIYDRCKKIITVSDYITKVTQDSIYKNSEKIVTMKNCINTKMFYKYLYKSESNILRNKYNIGNDEIVILFSGRLIPQKGVKELIIAFTEICNQYKTRLVIIGNSGFGNQVTNEYDIELMQLAEKTNEKIIFTGFIHNTELPKYHAMSDIAVVPSIWNEPAGLVVVEAMASGLPLIVTNSGGIPEYTNEESSIIIDNDNNIIGNIKAALEILIKDEKLRTKLANNGHIYAQQFNEKKYYDDFIKIIE